MPPAKSPTKYAKSPVKSKIGVKASTSRSPVIKVKSKCCQFELKLFISFRDVEHGYVKGNTSEHEARIKDIIYDSMYPQPDDVSINIQDDIAIVRYTASPRNVWYDSEYVYDNYGNGAPDGWMEGDIFVYDNVEIHLDIIHFNRVSDITGETYPHFQSPTRVSASDAKLEKKIEKSISKHSGDRTNMSLVELTLLLSFKSESKKYVKTDIVRYKSVVKNILQDIFDDIPDMEDTKIFIKGSLANIRYKIKTTSPWAESLAVERTIDDMNKLNGESADHLMIYDDVKLHMQVVNFTIIFDYVAGQPVRIMVGSDDEDLQPLKDHIKGKVKEAEQKLVDAFRNLKRPSEN